MQKDERNGPAKGSFKLAVIVIIALPMVGYHTNSSSICCFPCPSKVQFTI